MDPTLHNIQLKYSLYSKDDSQSNFSFSSQRKPEQINTDILPWFHIPESEAQKININTRLVPINTNDIAIQKLNLVNCNPDRYYELISLKDQFKNPNFPKARLACNPYENIGKSVFGNRAAVKLANIDALYNLTKIFDAFPNISPDSPYAIDDGIDNDFTFCDIASAPGSWSEYLQFRRPNSYGYAISIKSKQQSLNFDTSRWNMNNMSIIYGPEPTSDGNLYKYHSYFSNTVRQENPEGVNLVMADGGIEVDGKEELQEILSSRLILTELLVAMKCLMSGGKFLCKIFDSVLDVTQDIIYIAAICFDKISIIKPISSRPANSEMYLLGIGYREQLGLKFINIITNILSKYDEVAEGSGDIKEGIMFSNLFDRPLDEQFNIFMSNINDFSITNQISYSNAIIDFMVGKMTVIPELNLNMTLLLWKLPGNIAVKQKKKFNLNTNNENKTGNRTNNTIFNPTTELGTNITTNDKFSKNFPVNTAKSSTKPVLSLPSLGF